MKVEYKQIVKRGLLLALVIIIIQNILLMLADVPKEHNLGYNIYL